MKRAHRPLYARRWITSRSFWPAWRAVAQEYGAGTGRDAPGGTALAMGLPATTKTRDPVVCANAGQPRSRSFSCRRVTSKGRLIPAKGWSGRPTRCAAGTLRRNLAGESHASTARAGPGHSASIAANQRSVTLRLGGRQACRKIAS